MFTVRGRSWIVNIPYKTRYVLLAAYLASKNTKDTDKFTFGDSKKGRRKRPREGFDSSLAEVGGAQSAVSAALMHAPQAFTLERLLTIFKHIYHSHHHLFDDASGNSAGSNHSSKSIPGNAAVESNTNDVLILEGDHRFFAMVCGYLLSSLILVVFLKLFFSRLYEQINSLESWNFILAASSWRDDQPIYFCTVDSETIRVVARSVQFPLDNYIAH